MGRTTTAAIAALALVAGAAAVPLPALIRAREAHLARTRAGAPAGAAPPPDQFYDQVLDHFGVDATSTVTWPQRFWTNEQYWKGSGPLFLYVEGEGAGSPYDVLSGQHVELAANHSALILAVEHRFYGASAPTDDLSTENLKYLSSHQAVGDVARFLREYVAAKYNVTSVITFGGSYPGALSAWLRFRLPHLIYGAVSTSSPVEAQVDFQGYNNVVAASLSNTAVGGSDACLAAVKAGFAALDAAMRGTVDQQVAMSTKMSSCAPAVTPNDVMWFASNVAGQIMTVVQYSDETGGPDIASVCKTMTAAGVAPVDALATAIKATLGGAPCLDNSYDDFMAQIRNTTVDRSAGGVGIRQWTWQTCSQFGYYQACEAGTACPFSELMTLDSNFQICVDAFDSRVSMQVNVDRVNFSNDLNGGKAMTAPGSSSRILWVNGLIDPWHALSVLPQENSNPLNAAIVIPTGAHCRAMLPSSPQDPEDVKAARLATAAVIDGWVQQAAREGASLARSRRRV